MNLAFDARKDFYIIGRRQNTYYFSSNPRYSNKRKFRLILNTDTQNKLTLSPTKRSIIRCFHWQTKPGTYIVKQSDFFQER